MRQTILKAALAATLPLCALSAHAAGRCGPDTISAGGFESVAGVRLAGVVGGLQAGSVQVRDGELVFFEGTIQGGTFFVELPPMAPERMLELRVRGSGEHAFIELASYLGTVQQVVDLADGDGIARVAGLPTLRVNSESTARYALTQAAFGAQTPVVANECQLATLEAGLEAAALLERSAVIKILIENGGAAPTATLAAKGSVPTTLGVVQDEITAIAIARMARSYTSPKRVASLRGASRPRDPRCAAGPARATASVRAAIPRTVRRMPPR